MYILLIIINSKFYKINGIINVRKSLMEKKYSEKDKVICLRSLMYSSYFLQVICSNSEAPLKEKHILRFQIHIITYLYGFPFAHIYFWSSLWELNLLRFSWQRTLRTFLNKWHVAFRDVYVYRHFPILSELVVIFVDICVWNFKYCIYTMYVSVFQAIHVTLLNEFADIM